jgi:hypothetical protein
MSHALALGVGEPEPRERLVADLWFAWTSPQRSVEVVLVTVNGTIAGAFPRRVDQGERIPIHRKFLPAIDRTSWCLRIASNATALSDLRVWVELRDARGRCVSAPLCEAIAIAPYHVHTVQRDVDASPRAQAERRWTGPAARARSSA